MTPSCLFGTLAIARVYVPSSTDDIQETPNGGASINRIRGVGWFHDKASWEIMGINQGSLADIIDLDGYHIRQR